jgi:hypothetical protein
LAEPIHKLGMVVLGPGLLAVSTNARLKVHALPVARLGETLAFDLMLTQLDKITLAAGVPRPVSQSR